MALMTDQSQDTSQTNNQHSPISHSFPPFTQKKLGSSASEPRMSRGDTISFNYQSMLLVIPKSCQKMELAHEIRWTTEIGGGTGLLMTCISRNLVGSDRSSHSLVKSPKFLDLQLEKLGSCVECDDDAIFC